MFGKPPVSGAPKSLKDIRLGVQHASGDYADAGAGGPQPVACPSCGEPLTLSAAKDQDAGGGSPDETASPDLAGGGDEGTSGGL